MKLDVHTLTSHHPRQVNHGMPMMQAQMMPPPPMVVGQSAFPGVGPYGGQMVMGGQPMVYGASVPPIMHQGPAAMHHTPGSVQTPGTMGGYFGRPPSPPQTVGGFPGVYSTLDGNDGFL